jgi:putative transposase
MILSHRIALKPNNRQKTAMAKASGCARAAYNWALNEWKTQYEAWKQDNSLPKPNQYAINKKFNRIKAEEFPWMAEVTSRTPMIAIQQCAQAFQNFFAKRARYPKFRKKGIHDRFSVTNDSMSVEGNKIRLPKIGMVRMAQELRFSGKIMSIAVSKTAGRWHASIAVEMPDVPTGAKSQNEADVGHTTKERPEGDCPEKTNRGSLAHPKRSEGYREGIVGADLGISHLATLSTGETIKGPKPHKALLQRLKRLSKSLSRKKQGSKNRGKARQKLAKLHARIANIRNDALHKLTTMLSTSYSAIGIESLDVKGMLRNRRMSRSVTDSGFFEFRRQLEYKCQMSGAILAIAPKFYASSKTCSDCGHRLEKLPLRMRRWQCPICHMEHGRDVNAAINLRNMTAGAAASACGEGSSGNGGSPVAKLPSAKQEANCVGATHA